MRIELCADADAIVAVIKPNAASAISAVRT
jgi:hypothetical protein